MTPCNGSARADRHHRGNARRLARAGTVAALVLGAIGQHGAAADRLRLTGVDYYGDLPTLIAARDGHFARAGARVRVSYGGSGQENLAELRAGRTDFALMAMPPLVIDALADPDPGEPDDPVILANLSHARPVLSIMALDAPAGAGPEALEGRRIGIVDIRSDDIPAAFERGRIDAAVTWQPWTNAVRDRFGARVTEYGHDDLHVSRWLLVARRETLARAPGQTRAILRAYRSAVAWIQGNPDAANAAFRTKWQHEAAGGSRDGPLPLFDVALTWSLFSSFRQQLRWAKAAGREGGDRVPDFLSLVAPRPLARLSPGAVLLPLPSGGDP